MVNPIRNQSTTFNPIKYIEKDVKSTKTNVITLQNRSGENIEIHLAGEYDATDLQKFAQKLFDRMSIAKKDFNAEILANTVQQMIREEKMDIAPESVKVKTITEPFFSKMLRKIGLQESKEIASPAELRLEKAEQAQRRELWGVIGTMQGLVHNLDDVPNRIAAWKPIPGESEKDFADKINQEKSSLSSKLVSKYDEAVVLLEKIKQQKLPASPELLQRLEASVSAFKERVDHYRSS